MNTFEKIANIVISADRKKIEKAINSALKKKVKPTDILIKGMRKGIETVGQKFEKGEMFLPEMIKSADTMTQGVQILQPFIKAKKKGSIKKFGTIVIGTVQHDLHDIGKNIVSTFLDVSGFEVYDLGFDVSAEKFVEIAEQKKADIIGISALLTTTMNSMANVIEELKQRGLRDKYAVMVGGGPVTKNFAKKLKADGYGKDFVEAVQVAKKLVKSRR